MALTELMIKQARAEEKTYMLSDGKGLSLEIRPNGKKYWIIRYWINKKERRTSVGPYPGVTLKEAREKNLSFRHSLKSGKPIGFEKETFATVTEEWIKKRMNLNSVSYMNVARSRINNYIFPFIGHMKLVDITSGLILQLCRRIEEKGFALTAARVKQLIGQIFNYAIATNRADSNPTLALYGALQKRTEKNYSALTDPDKIAVLMRHIDAYPYGVVRCALKFSALTFCRPGEIRHAEWEEINWEKSEWKIPADKMKMKRIHVVPLAKQTQALLTELKTMTGHQKWLFPSAKNDGGCMSSGAVRLALRYMGYENNDMTAHGFRAMASTILNNGDFNRDHIEIQLAHAPKNAVRDAYNHAEYMPQRRQMMQWYADYLDRLASSVSI